MDRLLDCKEFLADNGYRILKIDNDDETILFEANGIPVWISTRSDENDFLRLTIVTKYYNEYPRLVLLEVANSVNLQHTHAKVMLLNDVSRFEISVEPFISSDTPTKNVLPFLIMGILNVWRSYVELIESYTK